MHPFCEFGDVSDFFVRVQLRHVTSTSLQPVAADHQDIVDTGKTLKAGAGPARGSRPQHRGTVDVETRQRGWSSGRVWKNPRDVTSEDNLVNSLVTLRSNTSFFGAKTIEPIVGIPGVRVRDE